MEVVRAREEPAIGPWQRAVRIATLSLLVVGFALRARGFLFSTIPFWEDEAAWAIRLVDLPLKEHVIRPLGFMALSKLLAWLFSPSETVLRLLPWLASVGALLLSPLLAKRLFSSAAARLLFVAIVALHPGAIDLSKEFKPYSVGFAVHLLLLLLALRYIDGGKLLNLAVLLGLLFTGTLLSQDAIFAYPAIFGVLLFEAFRARRVRHVVGIALTAVATLALLGTLYVYQWREAVGRGDDTTDYWGKKYDVFYVQADGQGASRLSWTAARIGELVGLPGMRRETWRAPHLREQAMAELKNVDLNVWEALGLLGLGALVYRGRRREAVLLAGPLVVMVAFNALGFWPLGAFRTNLFVLVYAAGLAGAAVDKRNSRPGGLDLVPAFGLVVAPFLLLGHTSHGTKSSSMAAGSAFTDAMRALASLQPRGGRSSKLELALDSASCTPWRYYTRYHPDKERMQQLTRRFDARCIRNLEGMVRVLRHGLTTPESRAFVLVSRARSIDDVETRLPPDLMIDSQVYVGQRYQLVVRVKRAN